MKIVTHTEIVAEVARRTGKSKKFVRAALAAVWGEQGYKHFMKYHKSLRLLHLFYFKARERNYWKYVKFIESVKGVHFSRFVEMRKKLSQSHINYKRK